ncbi:hypothetical protein Tco_0264445 [Tanacetum coccineum]
MRENDKSPSAQHKPVFEDVQTTQLRLEIGLKDALVEMPKFNKWLSSLLRNKEKLEEIIITTVNAECSAIIMNKYSHDIDLDTLPPTLEVSSSNPTSLTLTGEKVCSWKTPMFFSLVRFVWKMMTQIAIRKKIICLLATYLHQKPKLLSRPQEIEEIKEKEDEVSSDVPIHTIVMPIRITFDNPIDFNDHFSKPKDFKKDLTVSFDSSESSILPSPLLDSDSPFTAELSASVTLNSLGNEDKVFKPGILVYHAIHDKNLVTLEENLKENISSGTLLVFKEPSFLLPPPEPPDKCLNFEPILVMKNVVFNKAFYQSNVEDVNSFTIIIWNLFSIFSYTKESPFFGGEKFFPPLGVKILFLTPASSRFISQWSEPTNSLKPLVSGVVSRSTRASHPLYGYIKNHKKTVKNGQARTRESEEYKKKPKNQSQSQKSQTRSLPAQALACLPIASAAPSSEGTADL